MPAAAEAVNANSHALGRRVLFLRTAGVNFSRTYTSYTTSSDSATSRVLPTRTPQSHRPSSFCSIGSVALRVAAIALRVEADTLPGGMAVRAVQLSEGMTILLDVIVSCPSRRCLEQSPDAESQK